MRLISIIALCLVFNAEINQGWQGWVNSTWDIAAIYNEEITIQHEEIN